MIVYQKQIISCTAAADLSNAEGCFVTHDATAGTVALTAASSTADKVLGLINAPAVAGEQVGVILPGFGGIPAVRLHANSTAAKVGDTLALAANGTATVSAKGVLVAVALAPAAGGELVAVRLIDPKTVS